MYYVYILECSDKTLYIGTTNDVEKRIAAHNAGKTGAKYTKPRRPVRLVYMETRGSKSDALKREWEMKKLTRQEKLNLTKTYRPSSLSVDM
jgi:putative endonuclease